MLSRRILPDKQHSLVKGEAFLSQDEGGDLLYLLKSSLS